MDKEIKIEFEKIWKKLGEIENKISGKAPPKVKISKKSKTEDWYKPGSTIHKIITLIENGAFDKPISISSIVEKLKTMDYHLKSSDLTLPLRKIVRNGLLKKTKDKEDGSKSKNWLYGEN